MSRIRNRHASRLYDNCEIHIVVDRAIQMEGADRSEGADGLLIVAVELRLHGGRARLNIGPLITIAVPAPVGNDMHHGHVIHQRQLIAFLDSNARWHKLRFAHMHGWCLIATSRARG